LPFPGYWKNRLGLMTPTNPWTWMVFDEALFTITFDRIASRLFSISDAIYSYAGGLQNGVVTWTAALAVIHHVKKIYR
jgi:hypothetical protein